MSIQEALKQALELFGDDAVIKTGPIDLGAKALLNELQFFEDDRKVHVVRAMVDGPAYVWRLHLVWDDGHVETGDIATILSREDYERVYR